MVEWIARKYEVGKPQGVMMWCGFCYKMNPSGCSGETILCVCGGWGQDRIRDMSQETTVMV